VRAGELDVAPSWCHGRPVLHARISRHAERICRRPTPVDFAARLTAHVGGAHIYLKREDLTHTGAHKINNTVGQALLARRMGKKTHYCRDRSRPARCGHGHGRARFGMECKVFMGVEGHQAPACQMSRRRELLGSEWCVSHPFRHTQDAMTRRCATWLANVVENTF